MPSDGIPKETWELLKLLYKPHPWHGISAERVRQLEREALQKLRRAGDPDLAA